MSAATPRGLEYLLDRVSLEDLIHTYALATDARDEQALTALFDPGLVTTYGDKAAHSSREEAIGWILSWTSAIVAQQHLVVPYRYRIDGDRAEVLAYLISHQHTGEGTPVRMMNSTYRFGAVRDADSEHGWRIASLHLTVGIDDSRSASGSSS